MKAITKKPFATLVFLLIAGSLAVLFQNCSSPRLVGSKSEKSLERGVLGGHFCSKPNDLSSSGLKVLFVIDMSGSNIDQPNTNFANATDKDGIRFQKVREFIETCGGSNARNKFAITGFSGQDLTDRDKNSNTIDLTQGFVDGPTAISKQLQPLINIQNDDIARYYEQPTNRVMFGTDYARGLENAYKIIHNDIVANPVAARSYDYLVFFMTDGQPTDNQVAQFEVQPFEKPSFARSVLDFVLPFKSAFALTLPGTPPLHTPTPPGSPTPTPGVSPTPSGTPSGNCLANPNYSVNITQLMIEGQAAAGGIRFQTVYYNRLSPLDSQPTAKCVLDAMAKLGDSDKTVAIENTSDLNFCNYANAPIQTSYTVTKFGVVNLTSRMYDLKLWPDSDMDGLRDSEEQSLGFDPANARTNGKVLDVICAGAGGAANCAVGACDPAKVNGVHLNSCDIAARHLTDGLNSDQSSQPPFDRVPDLVELLAGTHPGLADESDNVDNDSIDNGEEIRLGRNPNQEDDGVSGQYVMDADLSRSSTPLAGCGVNQDSMNFEVPYIPLVETSAYTDNIDLVQNLSSFKLSHGANENVLFVYYIIEPLNSASGLKPELWGATVRVGGSSGASMRLDPASFQKLGIINGVPLQ